MQKPKEGMIKELKNSEVSTIRRGEFHREYSTRAGPRIVETIKVRRED